MKAKLRQLLGGILFTILLTASHTAFAFFDPTIGRWISRDPIEEQGGVNLYNFNCNNPITFVDYLGLVDYKFEVLVGNSWSSTSIAGWSGKWGQPAQNASGSYFISGASAYSSVTIVSRTNPWPIGDGNACNTVDTGTCAGTINLYLRNDCPGDFQVSIHGMIQLNSSGPFGAALGKLQDAKGNYIINGASDYKTGPFEEEDLYDFAAQVGKNWTLAATYTPTIAEPQDTGIKNTGTANGEIQFISATPK